MSVKMVFALILIVIALIMVFQNTAVVTFRFLFWNPAMSLIVWMLIVLAIGFVAGLLAGTLGRSGSKKKHAGM
jgi:uncharacterized integral membrane protein